MRNAFAYILACFVAASIFFGLLYRLLPLLAGSDMIAQFFVTEDGYLMLTVARNLAMGNGLSVSAGEISTNGVQPLATLIYALPYLLTGGDKLASLSGILLISTVISLLAVWVIRGFAREVLRPQTTEPIWSWVVAALWFVGPLLLLHSMNALETGLYTFAVTGTLWYFGLLMMRGGSYTLKDQIILGSLCGLVFLVRNDGVFLVLALFLVRFVHVQIDRQLSFGGAVCEAILPGVISLVWAAPWLTYNWLYFGSIVPISGSAQSISANFGQNLPLVPVKLFEGMFPMLPVPESVERHPAAILASLLVVSGVVSVFIFQVFRRHAGFRVALAAYLVFGAMLAGYYGLYFGASHFVSRYLAPVAPFLIVAVVSVALELFERIPKQGRSVAYLAAVAGLALSLVLLVRLLLPGAKDHGHFQVVDWVRENVPETTWVGAVQTGTLGYWHDRTINLDGKVNPEALRARRQDGDVLEYVTDSKIDYLADWVGIAGWLEMENASFTSAFEVVVNDPQRNIAVLRRRDGF